MPPKFTSPEFIMSSDWECLTVAEGNCDRAATGHAAQAFVRALGELVPHLPGPGQSGIFTGYGRAYIDAGHIEFAARESSTPYEFSLLSEQWHLLAARAAAALPEKGTPLLLTNNVHSGLLTITDKSIWGCHENYLVHRPPRTFARELLPFLATRVYGGGGGIEYPSGIFLAGVRARHMQLDVGGGTTHERALVSLGREEHHMGEDRTRFRCHLLLGDGHRSQWNRAMHFGCTALALKAIDFDATLLHRLPALPPTNLDNPWVKVTHGFNILALAGESPRVDPLVVIVQRVYLDGARRWADSLSDPPGWVGRLLDDWQTMLTAFERNDLDWLDRRLDAWIKYRLFTTVLKQAGDRWADVPDNKELSARLALVDHSYHEFTSTRSAFAQLDGAGALDHRVGDVTPPGSESEAYVPDTTTRARPRAQFIKEHRGSATLFVDWSVVHDVQQRRFRRLDHPFAQAFGPWQNQPPAVDNFDFELFRRAASRRRGTEGSSGHEVDQRLAEVLSSYEAGRYEEASGRLDALAALGVQQFDESQRKSYLRYRTFVETRRGMLEAARYLGELPAREWFDLQIACDNAFVARFSGLAPRHDFGQCVDFGMSLLSSNPTAPCPPALHEHHGASLAVQGNLAEAREVLERTRASALWVGNDRILARLLVLLADVYRQLNEPSVARSRLEEAEDLQVSNGYEGDLADFTCLTQARLETDRRSVSSLLEQARSIQTGSGNRMGLARTLLLQARLVPPRYSFTSERSKRRVQKLVSRIPALAECRLTTKIIAHWREWTSGDTPAGERDHFWGL